MTSRRVPVEVIVGGRDRLFLREQDGFSIESFSRAEPFSVTAIERWRRTLRRRARELARRGIPYVVAIVPDAHFMHREDVPSAFALPARAPGERWLDAMAELPGPTFVDLRPFLAGADGLLETYRKTDSHWTAYGAFVGYRALVRELARFTAVTPLAARNVDYEFRTVFGDLGVNVVPERNEITMLPTPDRSAYRVVDERFGLGRVRYVETLASARGAGRVFVDRDSTFTAMFDFMARSVRGMACCGTSGPLYLSAIERFEPDVAVSLIGERRLFLFESDHARDDFDDVVSADYASPQGRIVRKAVLAARGGDVEAAVDAIAPFGDARCLDPDHAYAIAHVLLAAGRTLEAEDALDEALAAIPDRPSFVSLKATIALAAREPTRARAHADRALALAPHNGFHHETVATVMLHAGDARGARRFLETALAEIDDSRMLYYLQSLACEGTGDAAAALEAMLQALLIDPCDPTFRDRARRLLEN